MSDRKKEYSELLKDPRWQRLRLQVFERDGWACQKCGAKDKMLAVHHRFYRSGRKPWEYTPNFLTTLCSDCHEEEYELRREAESQILESLFLYGQLWSVEVCSFSAEFDCAVSNLRLKHSPSLLLKAFGWALLDGPEAQASLINAYQQEMQRREDKFSGNI